MRFIAGRFVHYKYIIRIEMKIACKKEQSRTHKNMLKKKNLTVQKFTKITHVMGMSETLTLTGTE